MLSMSMKAEEKISDGICSSHTTCRSGLAALPQELFNLTLHFLGQEDLKSIQLASKDLCKATTPLLFQSWTIYPQERSFEQLCQTSETPEVASQFVALKYDARFADIPKRYHDSLTSPAGSRNVDWEDFWIELITPDECETPFSHSHTELVDYDVETALFIQMLPKLNHLKSLVIVENSLDPAEDQLPSFYANLLTQKGKKFEGEEDNLDAA